MTPVMPPQTVSADWLKQQRQQDARIEYHGPPITWPINKAAGETTQTGRTS